MQNPSESGLTLPADRKIELVLGAGGIKGFAHIGLLKALEEKRVDVGKITGVSVGSLVAAFYTNGYTVDQLVEIFLEGVGRRNDPAMMLSCLSLPDPLSFAIGGCLDLVGPLADMVRQYNLKPNADLQIFSCDILTQSPVLFEGETYDLGRALASSCSLPGVFRPVWQQIDGQFKLCVDGAWYHYNPTDFVGEAPAIVSTFAPASAPPSEAQLPIDLYFHFREMFMPYAAHRRYVDPVKHVVVEIDMPDVAGLNFGLSKAKCLEMVEAGYRAACLALDKAIAEGRVPVRARDHKPSA